MDYFTNIDRLRKNINDYYSEGKPFFFAVNYELTEGLFVDSPLEQTDVFFQFNDQGNDLKKQTATNKVSFSKHSIPSDTYQGMFKDVVAGIKQKNAQVVNLTVQTPIELNLDLEEVFRRSQAPFRVYVPGQFVCFSPERFVKIENGTLSAFPMKGTIDADWPDAQKKLLDDPKELFEHQATVNQLVKELGCVADSIDVPRFRYIDRITSLQGHYLQTSSEIIGQLKQEFQSCVGDLLFRLLPALSIVGTPRQTAMELITQIEPIPRGYYCGIAGYFDGQVLDTAVMIRFIEKSGNQLYYRSGGGVTAQSVCNAEYQEVLNKIYLPFV